MKRFKLVTGDNNTVALGLDNIDKPINWSLCVLCQSNKAESLQCPIETKRTNVGDGYKSLAANLIRFQEIGELSDSVCIAALDEGSGIEATLLARCAKWHKSCRDMLNATKLQRAEARHAKRHAAEQLSVSDDETPVVENEVAGCSKLSVRKTRSVSGLSSDASCCIFCDQSDDRGNIHSISTFQVDRRVRHCALVLQDTNLIAKLSTGDMVAIEAKYHGSCLANLYKKAKMQMAKENDCSNDMSFSVHGLAFAQLVSYIAEVKSDTVTAPVFKLADLAKKYQLRLEESGLTSVNRVNTTNLKNRLLGYFPDMRAQTCGKHVLLAFDDDIGGALSSACQQSSDEDALTLAKAAQIVRRSMFRGNERFNGVFSKNCQDEAVPDALKALINMILQGSSIETQATQHDLEKSHQTTLSLSQLLMFNLVKYSRKDADTKTRHSNAVEAPLPLYVAMLLHSATRQRQLVDKLFGLGLCVSYDSLLQISADLANSVTACFDLSCGICPPSLSHGLFTTGALDNIDHNPSSTTCQNSFHGTAISVTQHGTSAHNKPMSYPLVRSQIKSIKQLPESYSAVPPVKPLCKKIIVPDLGCALPKQSAVSTAGALDVEYSWLQKVHLSLCDVVFDVDSANDHCSERDLCISWPAFHASGTLPPSVVDKSTLLPLFVDAAHSAAMICHGMNIIKSATDTVNTGQVPVLTVDQPLYALAKQIQWNLPECFGESKFVIVLGGLHTEMTSLKTIGDWLEGSGWTTALVAANITTSGKAESMLRASHVGRTRHAHQVTAASLYILQQRAYKLYVDASCPTEQKLDFSAWCSEKSLRHPQFRYWSITLQFELAILMFVRSIRQSNFALYVDALLLLVPWFFALDHHHYARWVSVHLRDMLALSTLHPNIAQEFGTGKFTVHKTTHAFSALALDHAHEQINARIKGAGGAIGLTENPQALLRWMVAGPEVSRVIEDFEAGLDSDKLSVNNMHHEQNPTVQSRFSADVLSLVRTLEEMGNPFLDDGIQLVALDTSIIANDTVVETITTAHTLGCEQYRCFVKDRLLERTVAIDDPIKRNKLPLFKHGSLRLTKSVNSKLQAVKDDCNLFGRLYVACQTRDVSLDDFFKHENQQFPPSLSSAGQLRLGAKSDLLTCIEDLVTREINVPNADILALDGAAIVQMLCPGKCHTFEEYASAVFLPYIKHQLLKVKRIDLVWDQYLPDSLKATTRSKRGSGLRRRVTSTTAIPKDWSGFLRVDENKTELFSFLSKHVVEHVDCGDSKCIVATDGCGVLSSTHINDLESLTPCSQEEADSRLLLHVGHAARSGLRKAIIRTVDTDVVVLSIALMDRMHVEQLWIGFGTGKNFRYLSIHDIRAALGPDRSTALPFFHALTGCDTVSCFVGHGKKSAWQTWNKFPDITETFITLASKPESVATFMPEIERYIVLLYDRVSDKMGVNAARKQLFTKKKRLMEGLPPTQAALTEHVKRAAYQSGYCWYSALEADPQLPSPADWGWIKVSDGWQPLWSTLPEISKSCPELISCECKTNCTKRCRCRKAALQCTALCRCDGTCESE